MRVDFHFNVEHRLQYACRVVRKARSAGKTLLVFARNADRLSRFDTALWTFSALDFLPHVYAGHALAAQTPVWLSLDAYENAGESLLRDVLLNLDDDVPPHDWCGRFERVIEVVSRDDAERAQARLRFKAWKDRGVAPATHDAGSD